jgi:hypothetical protein
MRACSAQYPENTWSGGAGVTGRFEFSGGTAGIVSYDASTASTNDEPTSAECGPLQVITGSTAEIHDGTGTVVLVEDKVLQGEGILVNQTLAFGQVNDGTAGNWRVTTYAFCADG